MEKLFPESKELKGIIESHDWLLLDVSDQPEGRAHTWEEMEQKKPAEQFAIGHNYMFIPKPKKGHTKRDEYSLTKGLGPALEIGDPDDSIWKSLIVCPKKRIGYVAMFSRLFFWGPEYAVASSPRTDYLPEPDVVVMEYGSLVKAFREHFRIVKPEDIGASAPIPMPVVPARN